MTGSSSEACGRKLRARLKFAAMPSPQSPRVITGIEGTKNLQALSTRLSAATAHQRGEVKCDLDKLADELAVTVGFGALNEEKVAAIRHPTARRRRHDGLSTGGRRRK